MRGLRSQAQVVYCRFLHALGGGAKRHLDVVIGANVDQADGGRLAGLFTRLGSVSAGQVTNMVSQKPNCRPRN